jgi:bifunctional UDP-N-acetylglucosamine pyrophosphorylase/glucosamine-1-phosphate N-acetyltransferase
MQTVLLAADGSRRMEPLSNVAPTPTLPAGDRPLVAHAADAAVEAGTDELVFAVDGDASRLRSYFGTRYGGVPVAYADRDGGPGAVGALRAARDRLRGRVAVLDGRRFYGDVAALFEHDAAVAVHRAADASTDGGTTDRALAAGAGSSAPTAGAVDAGAYVFSAAAVESLDASADGGPSSGSTDAGGVSAALPGRRDPAVVELEDWVAVERPADLVAANERAVAGMKAAAYREDVSVTGTVHLADGATVERGATLEGPVFVAGGATVGRDAAVRGPVVVGPDAAVGAASTVESAVLFEGATVGQNATLRGGVLGPRCVVPEGARLAGVAGAETRGAATLIPRGPPAEFRYR